MKKDDHFECSCGFTCKTEEEMDEHFSDEVLPDAIYRWY